MTSRRARNQLNHPGLCSFEERGRSRVIPLSVRSEWWRAGQRPTSTTAMGGPQARITIERLSHVGKREQHASVSVSGLGILLSLSVHSFLIGWLLEYSVMLV